MEWEVKWALGSITTNKASVGNGILVDFIPIPKKGNAKECLNYNTIALISHISKVVLKILQAELQQYMNSELPDVQAGFRKGRGKRDQIANIRCIIEKQESSRKTFTSALLTMPKPLTVWITTNCGKFWKRWDYQNTWAASWENLYTDQDATVRTGCGTTDWFQIGKGDVKAVYCHPAYLTYMQSESWETLGWMKHKLESRLLGEISITSDMQMIPPLWQKPKNQRASWWKWKRRVKKLA